MKNIAIYLRRLCGFNRNARLFLVNTVLFGLSISLLVLLYNLYILSLGFHQDMIGLINMVAAFVAVIAALPMGWVANRLGYRNAQILGLVGTAFSIALPLIFPNAVALIVTELIWGVAFTLLVVVGAPFITDNSTDEERPYLFSLQFVLIMVTSFLGSLFGGELPRTLANWLQLVPGSPGAYQSALGVSVVLMLASALPFFFMKNRKGRAEHHKVTRPRLIVRDRRQVARLLLPTLVGGIAGGMFLPFVNVFWKVQFHLPDDGIGQIFAVSALLMTGVGMLAPLLTRRWGLVRVMVVTQAASIVGLLVFGFSPWFMLALAGYLGRDLLMNLSRPLTSQFQMELSAADERAAVSALATMAFNLAWGIGSWISGIWQTEGQFGLVFAVSAGFYVLSVVLLHYLFGAKQGVAEQVPTGGIIAMASPAE